MHIIWSPNSLENLESIRLHITQDDPRAASKMMVRISSAGDSLVNFSNRGRPTGINGVRELVIPGIPYLLTYRVDDETVQILSVWHGAQDRNTHD